MLLRSHRVPSRENQTAFARVLVSLLLAIFFILLVSPLTLILTEFFVHQFMCFFAFILSKTNT